MSFTNEGSVYVQYDKRVDALPPNKQALTRLIGNVHIALWSVMEWVMFVLKASVIAQESMKKMLDDMPIEGMEVQ